MLGRKLFHIVIGSSIPLSAFLIPEEIFLAALFSLTLAFLLFEFLRIYLFPSWSRNFLLKLVSLKEGESKGLTGASYLLISALLIFWLFDPRIAALSLFYLTIGDPMAALVGGSLGKFKLGRKSLLGSGAFVLAALIPASIFYFQFGLKPAAVLLGAVMAALVELLPLPLDDNLTVPLISALFISYLML